MRQAITAFLRTENGATAIEYGLIAALVILVLITALSLLGTNLGTVPYTRISAAL